MLKIIIDSKYHRHQFDDWLAGRTIEFKGKLFIGLRKIATMVLAGRLN